MSEHVKCVVMLENDRTQLYHGTVIDFDPLQVSILLEDGSEFIACQPDIELITYLR